MMTVLGDVMAVALLTPLLLLPLVIVLAILTGRMPIGGIWRDSFGRQCFSPSRVFQSIVALSAAIAALGGLASSGGVSFGATPGWLLALAGGGNAIYLGAKWKGSRR